MAKLIAAVPEIDVSAMVCRNPPKRLKETNSCLIVCAVEAIRAALKPQSPYEEQALGTRLQSSFTAAVEALF